MWRRMSDMDLREAAKLIGLDHVTYLRIEQGRMPSAETLRAVLFFLLGEPKQ